MNLPPLAEQLRQKTLDAVVGQLHLIGPRKPLSRMVETGALRSLIFWGPPGSGKTTLAHILATSCQMPFVSLSAISSGVGDLRKIFERATALFDSGMGSTLLFVDEIHRFNRAQQDSFLPYVEKGALTMVGATTENPSFELNNALLSRCQVSGSRSARGETSTTELIRAIGGRFLEKMSQKSASKKLTFCQ